MSALRRLWGGAPGVVVALAVLLVQTAIERRWPRPGAFLKYDLAARELAAGRLAPERLADFSPLYLDLHRLALALGLPAGRAVAALQALAVAAAAGLLFGLLRRRVGPALAGAGVAVFALDRHVVVYRTLLEPEALLLFAVLAVIVLARRPGLAAASGAGVAGALGLGLRATVAPLLALVPLAFYLDGDRSRRWRGRTVVFALPLAVAAALLLARARAATGSVGGPLMSPGTVFYEGNDPLSWGTSATYPPAVLALSRHAGATPDAAHQHYRDVARAAAGRGLSVADVNAFWRARALAFLGDEPGHALRLLGAKLTRAFQGFRWHDVELGWRHERVLGSPYLPFSLLAALGLLGLLLEARRWPEALLLYGVVASQLVVMLVFYVSARQRTALVPALVYFAAVALDELRRHPRRLGLGGLAALLALALALPDARIRDERHQQAGLLATQPVFAGVKAALAAGEPFAGHLEPVLAALAEVPWEGTRPAYFPQDRLDLETRIARRAAARTASTPSRRFDVAVALLAAGEDGEAEPLLRALEAEGFVAYRRSHGASLPGVYLGRIAARRGEREEAAAILERTLERAPGDLFALAELATLERPEAAAKLERYASAIDSGLLVGQAYLGQGRFAEAAAALGRVVARVPELREARIRLAAALAGLGADERAAEEYRRAASEHLEPIVEAAAFGRLFARWGAAHRDEAPRRLFAVQALEQVGRFAAAEELLAGWEPPSALRPYADEARRLAAENRAAEARLDESLDPDT